MAQVNIIRAKTARDMQLARELFVEYQDCLEFDLSFQDFEHEMACLPGQYAPPTGCILFAKHKGNIQGCVALQKLGSVTCEMKRMYVKSEYRGLGIGRRLAEAVIEAAKELNYQFMRLDFVSPRPAAQRLYESLGFKEIEPYESIPLDGAVFMELRLQ